METAEYALAAYLAVSGCHGVDVRRVGLCQSKRKPGSSDIMTHGVFSPKDESEGELIAADTYSKRTEYPPGASS